MAYTTVTAPAAGKTFAFDGDFPRSKIAFGGEGSQTDVSPANPMPVGAASLPLPAGAATSAKQDTLATALATLLTQAGFDARIPALGQQVGVVRYRPRRARTKTRFMIMPMV